MRGAAEAGAGESRSLPLWAVSLLASALVFGLAYLSIQLTREAERFAAIWPVNAALLVLLLRSRPGRWPVLLTAGYLGNILADYLCGYGLVSAFPLAACNTAEIAICAYGLVAVCGSVPGGADIDLTRSRDFSAFAVLCTAGALLSAGLAAAWMALAGAPLRLHEFVTWALADGLGLFVLTPALLLITDTERRAEAVSALATGHRGPLAILAALLLISVFGPSHSAFLLAPPLLVLIALEYELAGAAAAMLVVSVTCVILAVAGYPPAMFSGPATEQLIKLQFFLAVTASVILPLGSVVSQRASFRRDLANALKRAEDAAAAKSEFLATMSHELRTPLTSIIGFSGLLREDDSLDEAQARYVGRIADASQVLLSVINDVLDFSKLETGEVGLDPRPTSLAALIRQIAGLVGLQAQSKGLDLHIDLDPGLPEHVLVDDGRLGQVLLNLLGNAVKFTAQGEVRVVAAWADGRLTVSVTDTGPGIAADQLPRLFQRFSQADSSISRRFGGSGLGLAISRSLTELMGGSISAQTREGHGSTFTFDVAAPLAVAQAPKSRGSLLKAGEVRRVLMVDDAAPNRELVRTLLESAGLSVTEACDGVSGIAAAGRERFDLILMDVRMPGMDGLTATRRLRSETGPNRHTPILALTADVQPGDIEACRAAGMDDHVAKPIAVAELIGKAILWATPSGDAAAKGTA